MSSWCNQVRFIQVLLVRKEMTLITDNKTCKETQQYNFITLNVIDVMLLFALF